MQSETEADNRRWAQSLQRAERSQSAPERAVHFDLAESGSVVALKKLPADFAERVYEQKVLTSPGVSEGFDAAAEAIENWKQSL